jgi:hypothetical protein
MPGFVVIIGLMVLGAMLGFFFSKKGHEKEGAIKGAKNACGCVLLLTFLAIAAFVFLVFVLSQ